MIIFIIDEVKHLGFFIVDKEYSTIQKIAIKFLVLALLRKATKNMKLSLLLVMRMKKDMQINLVNKQKLSNFVTQ